MLIIVDIDGTVSDWTIRAKKAGIAPKRSHRKGFQRWLDAVQSEESLATDKGLGEVIEAVDSLYHQGHDIIFLTGRSEKYRDVTYNWLCRHMGVHPGVLIMRSNNDRRSAAEYKEAKLKQLLKEHKGLVLAIDDDHDSDCSKMYVKLGIRHLKVMPME